MGGFQRKPGGVFVPPVRDRHRDYTHDLLARNSAMPPRPKRSMPDKAPPPLRTWAQEVEAQIVATGVALERARESATTGFDVARDALSHQRQLTGTLLADFLGDVNHTTARLNDTRPPAGCPARLCDAAAQTSAGAHQLLEFAFNHGLKSRYLEQLRAAVVAFDRIWNRARATVQESAPPSTTVDDSQGGVPRSGHGVRWLQGGPARSSARSAGLSVTATKAVDKPADSALSPALATNNKTAVAVQRTPTTVADATASSTERHGRIEGGARFIGSAANKAAGAVQRKPRAQTSSQSQSQSMDLDTAVEGIIERIDGITGDDEEQQILAILRPLTPEQYGQVMARLSRRKDGKSAAADTYLARLHQDLHGDELHTWLALDRAKRLAARAGSPERMAATLGALEAGRGIATRDYAPSHITSPSTWSYRSYPEDATYRDGHIGVYWRKHQGVSDLAGDRSGHTLALDEFLRVNNRGTGKTEVLSAAQIVALSDDHRASAQFAKLTLITLAMGGVLVGSSKTLLGKVATGLFEIVLPAAGQYVADHEHQIAQMPGGRAFLRSWQIFNLSMAGFGVARLAWGPGRAVVHRLRQSADELAQTNPGNPVAATTAEQVRGVDDAVAELSGAARVVGLSADQAQATRLLDALGDAGMDANRLTALSDDAVVALRDADTAMAQGKLQQALGRLDEAGLSAKERLTVEKSLTRTHSGLMTDAVTNAGKPTPTLSNRMPEHKVSREGGGFSDAAHAKKNVRARRRELEEEYGKGYMSDVSDSEIYAERLYRGDQRNVGFTLGEPRASQRLGMEHKVAGDERPMVDMLVERRHGRLVPVEVKNQNEPKFTGDGSAAANKFREIADNAPKHVLDRIDHFEIVVHRKSVIPPNFKANAEGELWHLVDGTSRPPVWQRWEFAGKPVIVRRGDLGKISR